MREGTGPARDQPPGQHHPRCARGHDRHRTRQHAEPVRGKSHHRVQQDVPVDDQQHVARDVHQGRAAKHQQAQEQREAHRRRRRSCPRRCIGWRRGLTPNRVDTIAQPPTRYDGVARCGSEGPSSVPRRRCGAGAHRDPSEARRQPWRRALPAADPLATPRTPVWVGCGRIRHRRHQRPVTAGAPLATPLAHVPPSAAQGAHLNHRTSLAAAL